MEGQGVRDDKRTDAVGEEDSGVVQPSGIEEHVPTSSHRGRGAPEAAPLPAALSSRIGRQRTD